MSEDEELRRVPPDVNGFRLFLVVSKSAAPNVLSSFLLFLPETINILMISRFAVPADRQLAAASLAAVGLGNCLLNCLALAPIMGLNQALDTFVSMAYGAGDRPALYLYIARAQLVVLIYVLCVLPVLILGVEPLMILCRQEPEVARLAGEYCRAAAIGLLGAGLGDVYRKFFMNVGRTRDIQVWDGNGLAYPHRTGFGPVSDQCHTASCSPSCHVTVS